MTDSNNSAVSIVAIIAIVILVAGGLYFVVWTDRSGDASPTIEIDVDEVPLFDKSEAIPLRASNNFPVQWVRAEPGRTASMEAVPRFGW
jgi:hypothetical protein